MYDPDAYDIEDYEWLMSQPPDPTDAFHVDDWQPPILEPDTPYTDD